MENMVDMQRQVLTFALGAEVHGVDILRLNELRDRSPVTRLPRSPRAVPGVLDLRVRFG